MGFGLPAAMGVQLAFPDATVACVTGEASFIMCMQELSTCLQYGLPVKIVNLNNRYMGMVRQWQEFFYDRRYSHSYMDALPDFVKMALRAFGHVGIADREAGRRRRVRSSEAFGDKDAVHFIDFITDQTENVYPMIAAGNGTARDAPRAGSEAGGTRAGMRRAAATIISMLLENEAGALSRVSGLFSPRRAYNIESLDRRADGGS